MNSATTARSVERSITLVRDYPVAPERVFAAWTEPDQLEWFSGLPTTQSHPSVDLRPGGFWRLTLQEGEGGRSYPTGGLYHVVEPPHRLVFSWGAVGGWPDLDPDDLDAVPTVSLDFTATGTGTRMTAALSLSAALDEAQVAHWFGLGIREGWTTTIDRIAQHLSRR
ncbi:SRPBCC family protein [Kineococcus sp. SYSU DK003]|uniref:SRPBCC family protein n=1 Tax=Kineococcus sp. SYSU DK003 TaxID=3383124 RepID=UPI003D7C9545